MDKTSTAGEMVDAVGEEIEIRLAGDATLEALIRVRGRRNKLIISEQVVIGPAISAADPNDRATLIIDGDDNIVVVGQGTRLNVRLVVRGTNHKVEIGDRCFLQGRANLFGSNANLYVGSRTTMTEGSIQLHESGSIKIGQDCMISSQVYASISDMHPIYDRVSGQRINPAASIDIGDHVWIGLRSMILKGASIGKGSVIAAGAIVSNSIPSHTVAAGVPAKVVRKNITWRRDFAEQAPEPILSSARPKRWGFF